MSGMKYVRDELLLHKGELSKFQESEFFPVCLADKCRNFDLHLLRGI